ncbi:MAG: Na/Pi cotransporter family protein [Gammaproteobacteria bacterium]|nr:MAG: Na/Pi cotransporter family protein [Gammaproteobacteria bacterium]
MLNKIFFPALLMILAYSLWLSPDFTQIAAGVAIFLFGVLSLKRGFHGFTGGTLEKILRRCTDKLWKSLSFGLVSTTLMQSSSLVSVLAISFLSVGLLDLASGIGIIFGANLGTTASAWLIAGFGLKVKIANYAMPMLVFGVLLVFQKSKTFKAIGAILVGMGFLFLGIHYMKEGFSVFRDTQNLAEYAMPGIKGLLLFILIGVTTTVIIQSSDATMAIIITALSVQQITYENSLALAIGANIGTTITAILSAIGVNIEGKRLAAAHLIFNVITACVALLMMQQFIIAVDYLARVVHIAADDYTLKLAMFHTLFNVTGILLLLPLVNKLVRLIEFILKGERVSVDKPEFLNAAAMAFPDTVVLAVHQETLRLYRHARYIILKTLGFSVTRVFSEQDLQQLLLQSKVPDIYNIEAAYDRNIKGIYSAIIAFISLAGFTWEIQQSGRLYWLREASRHIVEAVKDTKHLQKNLLLMNGTSNMFVKQEYDKIRYQIAELFRELESIRIQVEQGSSDINLLSFDLFKVRIKEQDQLMNSRIDGLIREHKITPEAGTSLINDSAYMYEIKKHLVAIAETLFVKQEEIISQAQRELVLDDNELVKVIETSGNDLKGA